MCKTHKKVDAGLFAARLALAIVFIVHGWWKLSNMEGTTGFFTSLGIPAPALAAWVVALVEFVGGLAMLAGVYVCVAGGLLFINMLVAMFLVHWKNGFSVGAGGYEFVLALALVSLGVALVGPGKWSIGKGKFCCSHKKGICVSCAECEGKDACCGGEGKGECCGGEHKA